MVKTAKTAKSVKPVAPPPLRRAVSRGPFYGAWKGHLEASRVANVQQPWATAIMYCKKTIENRMRPFHDKRWVLILASKSEGTRAKWDGEVASLRAKIAADPIPDWERDCHHRMVDGLARKDYPRGGVIGAALVDGCVDADHGENLSSFEDNPWLRRGQGGYGWLIKRVIPFSRTIPLRGSQSSYVFYAKHRERHGILDDEILRELSHHDPSFSLAAWPAIRRADEADENDNQ